LSSSGLSLAVFAATCFAASAARAATAFSSASTFNRTSISRALLLLEILGFLTRPQLGLATLFFSTQSLLLFADDRCTRDHLLDTATLCSVCTFGLGFCLRLWPWPYALPRHPTSSPRPSVDRDRLDRQRSFRRLGLLARLNGRLNTATSDLCLDLDHGFRHRLDDRNFGNRNDFDDRFDNFRLRLHRIQQTPHSANRLRQRAQRVLHARTSRAKLGDIALHQNPLLAHLDLNCARLPMRILGADLVVSLRVRVILVFDSASPCERRKYSSNLDLSCSERRSSAVALGYAGFLQLLKQCIRRHFQVGG
jgi:hypothetical protein